MRSLSSPDIHFVPVKYGEQQGLKAIRSARKALVEHRTSLDNQIRGLAAEYGVAFPLPIKALLPLAIEDIENKLSHVVRSLLQTLCCDFIKISDEIDEETVIILTTL